MTHSTHGHGCRCPEHHSNRQPPPRGAASLWAVLAPAASCAGCPACMALWKPLLTVVGVTFAFSDTQHAWLLFGSLTVALAVAVWDARRSGLWAPFWLTAGGSLLLLGSHLLGDVQALEWTGLLVLAASVPLRWVRRSRLSLAG